MHFVVKFYNTFGIINACEHGLLRDAWTLAIEAMSWMELRGLSESVALSRTAEQLGITDFGVKGLAHRLVYETVRRKNYLDSLVNQALKPYSLDDYDLGVRAFLRLYAYKTKIERKENAYKEAVEIARLGRAILGWKTLHRVEKALGILLSVSAEGVLEHLSDITKIALLTCHPTFFVEYLFRLLGRDEALRFLASSQVSLPIYVRVNTLRASEEKIIETLENEGLRVEKVSGLSHVYEVVETKRPLASTQSFRKGLFYVEDKASSLVVEVATPEPDLTVFDVCAAPGTKTTHLAMLMRNTGAVYSVDFSRRRMSAWKRNVAFFGVENAMPIIADARESLPLNRSADLVVLDPPCTNTGVFARVPSAKWRLTPHSVLMMMGVQWQMLKSCAEVVRAGGFLVYSTCSVSVEENEMQIERFLRLYPEFSLVEAKPWIGIHGLRGLEKCQRLLPHVHRCNGFFIAKLRKEA